MGLISLMVPVCSQVKLWLNVHNVRTSTSVSGDLITMQSCPLGDAWPAWSSISVSASSCFIHNSSTLLQSIPFSPSVSLWHSIPSVTQSEPKSANHTKYYSGFCHSCIRKYARFSLCCFLQSGISSTGWDTSDCRAGQLFECYRLHHSVLSLWVLDGYIRILIHDQVIPGPVLGRQRCHEMEDIAR